MTPPDDAVLEALSDPVEEAAAQILAFWYNPAKPPLDEVRASVAMEPTAAAEVIQIAARQIDRLRALGAIPPAKE